ncbi:hypothetical protein [Ancylobacter mangrovi]|uniref:hypothetical protein n=1 Tax=Ancylobacter mangrovi TaxID=2972472 RepID=UPI002162EDC5|nr:hypothetical protein [Ancylobacter mangrovi]MCS0501603.1 hypothetical protein [Ancylobacter mangrovi]
MGDFNLISPPAPKKARVRCGGWSWGPVEGAKLRVLSNGGGIQSSTLIMMMCVGELPWVDHIINADPGDELSATYRHLEWLEAQVLRYSNGRVMMHRVSRGGRLSDRIRNRATGRGVINQDRFVTIPAFTGRGGQGKRQCTREFKIEPLEKKQRELLGFAPRQRIPAGSCEVWIGISTDEVVRAGAAFTSWTVNRYPLLEKRMSRMDCVLWLQERGFPVPPKSACIFCPYKTNAEWRWLRDNDPQAWADAVEIDRLIRNTPSMREQEFLHRDRVPLDQVDLRTDEEAGQGMLMVCEAGCGL